MPDNNNVADKFRGLPIAELIAAPLKAVCDSQRQLAASTYDYIMQIGFNHEKEKNPSPRLVEFDLERPLKTGGTVKIGVQAPFLGLVPIPAMMVNEVNIDFQMEVTDTETTKSNTASDATVSVDASYGFLFAKANVKMSGKVSSSRENTRTTNQTAKYQVHVVARQQQPTEGMSKLMDILSSCVEEITGDAEEVKK
jgi:hypothetical protein